MVGTQSKRLDPLRGIPGARKGGRKMIPEPNSVKAEFE